MTKITIDENHVYRTPDGRVIQNCTGIIRAAGLMDTAHFTDYARDRGSAVHKAVELYEQDDLDEDTVDIELIPYLDAWRAFKAATGFLSTAQELLIYNEKYNYAGTLDMTGIMQGATTLIDLKTGVYQHWWALQTAAYNAVAKCKRRLSVELHGDGKYRVTEHTDKRDFQRFLAAMTVAGMRREWGLA